MTTIKIVSKSNNFPDGANDWSVLDGKVQTVKDDNAKYQNMAKMVISKMNENTGYGCSLKEFRGMKDQILIRLGIMIRLLRSTAVLEKWHNEEYELDSIQSFFNRGQMSLTIKLKTGEVTLYN